MRVKVAQGAGFCFGVKRAVQMAVEAAGQGMVCSLGPLIHNPREIARLSSLVRVIDSLEEVACTNTAEAQPLPKVVIRSHGVGPQVYAQAGGRNLSICAKSAAGCTAALSGWLAGGDCGRSESSRGGRH